VTPGLGLVDRRKKILTTEYTEVTEKEKRILTTLPDAQLRLKKENGQQVREVRGKKFFLFYVPLIILLFHAIFKVWL